MAKSIKVIHKKLGQQRAWGLAEGNKIELEKTLTGRRHLLYLLHEMLHVIHPDWSETKVVLISRRMCKVIWDQRYRRSEL